jgi:hypothetical protein
LAKGGERRAARIAALHLQCEETLQRQAVGNPQLVAEARQRVGRSSRAASRDSRRSAGMCMRAEAPRPRRAVRVRCAARRARRTTSREGWQARAGRVRRRRHRPPMRGSSLARRSRIRVPGDRRRARDDVARVRERWA